MILFYSEFCQHCNILLETIRRHDTTKMVKLVSIDTLRSLRKPIDPKIHSVPALLLLQTKEYLFGKAVFDYLLLPNRGVLFSGQLRDNKNTKDTKHVIQVSDSDENRSTGDPQAFTLGSISAEYFSSIEDTNSMINDKNYKWDLIDNNAQISTDLPNMPIVSAVSAGVVSVEENDDKKQKLPSLEEIMKRRAQDII